MATNCIYRSVSLQAGESFTLPPGAEIVSATDINAITSTCPIPDNLEALECYIFVLIAGFEFDAALEDNTFVWEGCGDNCNAYMPSITVGGVTYTFASTITADGNGIFNVGQLASEIASNPSINGMMLSIGVASDSDDPNGGVATLCFKTTPSIAAETYVTLYTQLIGVGSPVPTSTVRVYAQKLSDYTNGAGTCACAATT